MAKKQGPSNAGSEVSTHTFNKGLIKDYDDVYFPEGTPEETIIHEIQLLNLRVK